MAAHLRTSTRSLSSSSRLAERLRSYYDFYADWACKIQDRAASGMHERSFSNSARNGQGDTQHVRRWKERFCRDNRELTVKEFKRRHTGRGLSAQIYCENKIMEANECWMPYSAIAFTKTLEVKVLPWSEMIRSGIPNSVKTLQSRKHSDSSAETSLTVSVTINLEIIYNHNHIRIST